MLNISAIDPVAFKIFAWPVYWYGIAYVVSILLAVQLGKFLLKINQNYFGFSAKLLDDFVPYFIIGILLGGRLGHIIFFEAHNYQYFLDNPLDIMAVWQGGMSFHGGFIGAFCVALIFCNKNKIKFINFVDLLALVTPIGLFFGRIANFINYEVYGLISFSKWSVKFGNHIPRYPTQIYEALTEGLLLFIILNILFNYVKFFKTQAGSISIFFTIGYGFMRSFIEPFKVPSIVKISNYNLNVGLCLSLAMLVIGSMILTIKLLDKKP